MSSDRIIIRNASQIMVYVGPRLASPSSNRKSQFSYDTRNTTPLDEYGTVYQIITVSGSWGQLTVTEGALIGINRDKVTVSNPTSINKENITGGGWTLKLNKGFIIEKNSTGDNYFLRKE